MMLVNGPIIYLYLGSLILLSSFSDGFHQLGMLRSGYQGKTRGLAGCGNLIMALAENNNNNNQNENMNNELLARQGKYPLSKNYYEEYVRRLNSKNISIQNTAIIKDELENNGIYRNNTNNQEQMQRGPPIGGLRIIIGRNGGAILTSDQSDENEDDDITDHEDEDPWERAFRKRTRRGGSNKKKSENFEVIEESSYDFSKVGGYESVKAELEQCVDILKNVSRYEKFNVRIPRGLIFEGPPGNGKTLLAKALAGEAKLPFIPVSGAQFQEKYVGVGASRMRELFKLASDVAPVIVFIDEIDAVGRKRAAEGDTSSSERDNTLNELLVAMDGFKNVSGVFIVGATNRADLLDSALLRPGRIDKRVYIGNPDPVTRNAILNIHSKGKPMDVKIKMADMVEMTAGLSGAQIENLLNEAMLNAIRSDRDIMIWSDIELVINRMMVGWQPTKHQFTTDLIDHIAIHEMGHAIVGLVCKNHAKVTKVIINLSAPKSPGYTVFEATETPMYTREALSEHLMILLAGRVAEEVFYNTSVTTGAINDFEEALKLAEKMVIHYGMGTKLIYPINSDKYKTIIDEEVTKLIEDAYRKTEVIVNTMKDFVSYGSKMLQEEGIIHREKLEKMLQDHNDKIEAEMHGVDYVIDLDLDE